MWGWRGTLLAGRALLFPRPASAAVHLRATTTSTVVAAAKRTSNRVTQHEAEYWDHWLERMTRKAAINLKQYLDTSRIMGLPTPEGDSAAGSSGSGGEDTAPPGKRGGRGKRRGLAPLYPYFAKVKREFPLAVVLVRVGEFYEAQGSDAAMLVEHAGLNPMGAIPDPPRAGCPRGNLRQTVDHLVSAGLTVVVCEETSEDYGYGSKRTKQKERYVAWLVSPANPHLLHGCLEEGGDLPIDDSAPPLLAVVPQAGGYTLAEVRADVGVISVLEGLTEDAVLARLHEGGLAPPLFLHVPPAVAAAPERRLTEVGVEREFELRVASIFGGQVGSVQRYSDVDWKAGLLTQVRLMTNLGAEVEFTEIIAPKGSRPRPLYYCTASNLGLHKTRGQPALLDFLLPPGAPLAARKWLLKLLLQPPAPTTAVAVHSACSTLRATAAPLPGFPSVAAAAVVLKLRDGRGGPQANEVFFRELGALCRAVEDLLTRGGEHLPVLAGALLQVAVAETGTPLTSEQLLAGCQEAQRAIHAVVDHDTRLCEGVPTWQVDPLQGAGEDERAALEELLLHNERKFRGRVRAEMLETPYENVSLAFDRVRRELAVAMAAAQEAQATAAQPKRAKAKQGGGTYLEFDSVNNSLRIKGVLDSETPKAGLLVHPTDRYGKRDTSGWSTNGLQSALDDYRRSCYEAEVAVRAQLCALAKELQGVNKELVCAATMGVVFTALDAHTREALRRKWQLPVQGFEAGPPPPPPASGEPEPFELTDFWPYWLDGGDRATVPNSLSLDGMALLTGPNMAGKSTILRSVAAVALLGAAGLHVPAAQARVPYFDAFMLRTFSGDSPLEGQSAFANEMKEMRYVLEDVTPQSLVLVDELGKGTEVKGGTALAGALCEELDMARCRGVFATHLHALPDLELDLPNTEWYMMETALADDSEAAEALGEEPPADADPAGSDSGAGPSSTAATLPHPRARRPTWRMVPGICTESMALDVARRNRLPHDVLARAQQLYDRMEAIRVREDLPDASGPAAAAAAAADEPAQAQGAPAAVAADAASSSPASAAPAAKNSSSISISSSSSSNGSQWTLEAAAETLQQVAQQVLAQAKMESELQEVHLLQPRQMPGTATTDVGCVYVLRRPDGHFYTGQSDALQDRLRTHRQTKGKGGKDLEMAYICLGRAFGLAKAIESATQIELQRRGFPQISTKDAGRRHRGGGGAAGPAS